MVTKVWHAHAMDVALGRTTDTGYITLNAVLPGGGWPVGALIELLQTSPGSEWNLLTPALARQDADKSGGAQGPVVLVDAPYQPFGPALAAQLLDPNRLLCVQAGVAAAQLWATEQALRCTDVAAVLAWLPRVQMPQLRRLHIAAQEHGKLLFVFRPVVARAESSPAPLRVVLQRLPGLSPRLQLDVFKRRGPPLQQPLELTIGPARLNALLAASRARSLRRRPAALPLLGDNSHALDRLVATHSA
ncbi:MAG TPA: translesion DNA synthesis-associated protein ImuA [Polaromonas sp.]|uniref:translesion DNA synthesis-associated protein ImuA n=1 Tax=Polaromonas sp. TaxID=1869339 RepID=UPI002D6BBF54|nr:translesion DNA synthesis-associated protein ImuA [Polaromonas sp.]HYW57236.1 translesion DNA synthesis-associated protein ImuA [Polaromonas sp.]